eukprot:gene28470-35324_t
MFEIERGFIFNHYQASPSQMSSPLLGWLAHSKTLQRPWFALWMTGSVWDVAI